MMIGLQFSKTDFFKKVVNVLANTTDAQPPSKKKNAPPPPPLVVTCYLSMKNGLQIRVQKGDELVTELTLDQNTQRPYRLQGEHWPETETAFGLSLTTLEKIMAMIDKDDELVIGFAFFRGRVVTISLSFSDKVTSMTNEIEMNSLVIEKNVIALTPPWIVNVSMSAMGFQEMCASFAKIEGYVMLIVTNQTFTMKSMDGEQTRAVARHEKRQVHRVIDNTKRTIEVVITMWGGESMFTAMYNPSLLNAIANSRVIGEVVRISLHPTEHALFHYEGIGHAKHYLRPH